MHVHDMITSWNSYMVHPYMLKAIKRCNKDIEFVLQVYELNVTVRKNLGVGGWGPWKLYEILDNPLH